jgi:hypothetical protein
MRLISVYHLYFYLKDPNAACVVPHVAYLHRGEAYSPSLLGTDAITTLFK